MIRVLVIVGMIVVGLLLIFTLGNGLERLSVRRQIRLLRREGRTIPLGAAITCVRTQGFLFVEDRRSRPMLLWVIEETLVTKSVSVEILLGERGLLVERGSDALDALRRETALAERIVVVLPGAFID